MKNQIINRTAFALLCGASLLAATTSWSAPLAVDLYAKVFYLNPITGDTSPSAGAGLIPMWGFASTAGGDASVPGPQINVDQTMNDGLAITVHNTLPEPISVVIPGLSGSADVGQPARFAGDPNYGNRVKSFVPEVANGGSRTFTWTGLKPGTFVYHSGTHPALQVQMGLFGMVTIKVGPTQAYPGVAIGDGGEVPVIFSEIDPVLHQAVAAGNYGPGQAIRSTIHSEPSFFLINGRAFDPAGTTPPLTPALKNGLPTLFRMINVGWNSHIPSLTGPFPSGSANYLTVIAEDGEPYPYPKTLYAPNMAALKTMDIQFTPPAGPDSQQYQLYDRKLGLANGGGMFRILNAAAPTTQPLTLACAADAGQVGAPYASALVAGGGTPTYTYSITSGALPDGLTLDPVTGAITGTPTTDGTVLYTAQVVDSTPGTPLTATVDCSITIAPSAPPPLTLACAADTGQVGVPYASALVAGGGTPTYTYSITSGALPDGLTLNPATGEISGTPTTAGSFAYTAQVDDSLGAATPSACSITIAPALSGPQTYANTTPITRVPATGNGALTGSPASTYPSQITVAGFVGTVSKVTLTLHGLSHTRPQDIDAVLIGPSGTAIQSVKFMSDVGSTTGGGFNNVTITFDQAAAGTIGTGTSIPAGTSATYQPGNSGTFDLFPSPAPSGTYGATMNVFNSINPNGTWSLYIVDDNGFTFGGGPGTGNLAGGWSLTISP